ncbi:MAG: DUF4956 domain-containing protein [Treponema sp.]|jgi:hypothetical protein|nr:DUF4956 domain-containing protein [Treponema sp.]
MPLDFFSVSLINGIPTLYGLVICTFFSLIFGLAVAGIYMYKNKFTRSMALTLVLLPAIVQVIIMLVNGNIGVGIAVAGAFSLIRFRSIPGTAKEIGALFFAMALGFVTGLGYIFYALIFLLLVGGAWLLLTRISFGDNANIRFLKIKIPENLDYDGLFDDILEKYTNSAELKSVTTTNMGSLFELVYTVSLKPSLTPKAFIDELRCRNGNLNIRLSRNRDGEEL